MSGKDSAFPIFDEDGAAGADRGLTKRELFAAMAMQGWMATYGPELEFPKAAFHSVIAENCVAMADALLAALKEPSP